MGAIDSLLGLATEQSTKKISEKIIRIDRLLISLNKVCSSFRANAITNEEPQKVHLQAIEDIIYQNPHLFDDSTISSFFSIKDELDVGILNFPLLAKEHELLLGNIRKQVLQKRKKLLIVSKVLNSFLALTILGVFAAATITGAALVSASWDKLFQKTRRTQTLEKGQEKPASETTSIPKIVRPDTLASKN